MEGVTILYTYQAFTDGWALIMASCITAAIVLLIISISNLIDGNPNIFVGSTILMIGCIILCFLLPKATYYDVLPSESVNWQEFTEHYKIEKARGQILTVREVKDD